MFVSCVLKDPSLFCPHFKLRTFNFVCGLIVLYIKYIDIIIIKEPCV